MANTGKRSMNDVEQSATSPTTQRRGLRRRLGFIRSSEEALAHSEPVASPSASRDETEASLTTVTTPTNRRASSPTAHLQHVTMSPSKSKRYSPTASSSGPSFTSTEISSPTLARKGVKYGHDGSVVCCRFCEILRTGDADFVYEDDEIAVFRPLSPVVDSHVLVVPRCHIRNINMLTTQHLALLNRMKQVAEIVLGCGGKVASSCHSIECKFAFHKPPFNSIDHVHMHAFRKNEGSFGCVGSIKYRTETWWCRSLAEVLSRVDGSTASIKSHNTELIMSTLSSSLESTN